LFLYLSDDNDTILIFLVLYAALLQIVKSFLSQIVYVLNNNNNNNDMGIGNNSKKVIIIEVWCIILKVYNSI